MLGSLTGRLLGLPRQCPDDERTHGRNARKPFLARMRARLAPRAPVFESWRARRARKPKNRAWEVSYISNQAFLTHTGNITYDDHVLDSLNEIPPTARAV